MNNLRHFYLYAKGWYKRTDVIDDLKIIQGNWCGIEPKYITASDVASQLAHLAYRHINNEYFFVKFINDLSQKVDSWNLNIINTSLSTLKFIGKEDLPFDLGEPDYELLPEKYNFIGES